MTNENKDRLEGIKDRFVDFRKGSTLQYNKDMDWLIAEVERLRVRLEGGSKFLMSDLNDRIESLIKERDQYIKAHDEWRKRAEYWMSERDEKNNIIYDLTKERDELKPYEMASLFKDAKIKELEAENSEFKRLRMIELSANKDLTKERDDYQCHAESSSEIIRDLEAELAKLKG